LEILGASLIQHYNGNLKVALFSVYTEHPWDLWKFIDLPQDQWKHLISQLTCQDSNDLTTLKKSLEQLGKAVGITREEDLDSWYQIDLNDRRLQSQFEFSVLRKVVQHLGGLADTLRLVYPKHNWQHDKFIMNQIEQDIDRVKKCQTKLILQMKLKYPTLGSVFFLSLS